jgi:hypothetical protein
MVTQSITERRIKQFIERKQMVRADPAALCLPSGKAIRKHFVLS